MNSLQRSEFRRLEKVIDDGKKTFIEVGSALKQIRDDKLHLETHGNFAEYVEQRFGFKKTHAYQLIASADTAESVRNCGHFLPSLTESQAREIAKAPEEKKEEVVSRAAEIAEETGKPPTAQTFKQAREEVCADEKSIEPADEVMTDVEMAMDNASVGREIVNAIRKAIKLVNAVEPAPGTEGLVNRRRRIVDELKNAVSEVQVHIPHAVCPRCDGDCFSQCGNHGWVNSILFKELS